MCSSDLASEDTVLRVNVKDKKNPLKPPVTFPQEDVPVEGLEDVKESDAVQPVEKTPFEEDVPEQNSFADEFDNTNKGAEYATHTPEDIESDKVIDSTPDNNSVDANKSALNNSEGTPIEHYEEDEPEYIQIPSERIYEDEPIKETPIEATNNEKKKKKPFWKKQIGRAHV